MERELKSKSDDSLHLTCIRCEQNDIAPRDFEYIRDDSDLNLKSQSKIEIDAQLETKITITSSSEGTLLDDKKKNALKRRSSLKYKVTKKSIQWNFNYISPYALTDKQKRENNELKLKTQKQRKQALRRKFFEKEKKQYENHLAFEKWKRQKHEKIFKHYRQDIWSIYRMKFDRNRHWYP
jgi:hypothetical protein